MRFLLFVATLCLPGFWASAQKLVLYVSPNGRDSNSGANPRQALSSLQTARDKVRRYKQQHPADTVWVYLLPGDHLLSEPLVFTPEDGGTETAPVVYAGVHGGPVVLNGGRKISGWKKHSGNIWVAHLPAAGSQWSFSELYVNGKARNRARLPRKGFYQVAGLPEGGVERGFQRPNRRFGFKPGDIKSTWKNLRDVEVTVYHFWTDTHLKIDSVNETSRLVSFQSPSGKTFTDDFSNEGARYVVESVWEGLQEPGDWYLDKQKNDLYYIPYPDENMATVSVWAPFAPSLLRLLGDPEGRKWITGLHFRNIIFQYANAQLPSGSTNNTQASADVPAAITLSGAKACEFRNCTVQNISGYAFEVLTGSWENRFINNRLVNLGGGGIRMNGGTADDHPLRQTHSNLVSDNEIGPYGSSFPSAVGVLLMHARDNQVVHNLIHHGFYTGVSVGWEWGYQRSISVNNTIAYNHIHHIGQGLLSDMGGVYTLGVSPGTAIRNNLIHDVNAHQYGGWGIYNDEGSTHILVENNIVHSTKFAGYNMHYGKEITVRNNIFAAGRLQQISRSRTEPHESLYFENNIVYWKEGVLFDGEWQDKPYSFYFGPAAPGTNEVSSTFRADHNVYYNPSLSLGSVKYGKSDWKAWQKAGKDIHSVYADPMFVDAARHDFTLRKNSPALLLGFNPIDTKSIGPRK